MVNEAVKELLIELEGAKEENVALKTQLSGMTSTLASDFVVLSDEPRTIKGIAIAEGTWNGDFYPAEVLSEIPKVGAIPVLVEHGDTEEFGTKAVGLAKEFEYIPLIDAVAYKTEITDEKAWKKIEEGKFKGVSLHSFVGRGDGGHKIVYMKPFELSLTSNPAVRYAYVAFSKMYLNGNGAIRSDIMPEKKEEAKLESVAVEPKLEQSATQTTTSSPSVQTASAPPAETASTLPLETKTELPAEEEGIIELEVKDGEVLVVDVMTEEEALKKKKPRAKVKAGKYYYYGKYGYPPYYYGAYGYPSPYYGKKRKLSDEFEDFAVPDMTPIKEALTGLEATIKEAFSKLQAKPEPVVAPAPAVPVKPEPEKVDISKLSPADLIILAEEIRRKQAQK